MKDNDGSKTPISDIPVTRAKKPKKKASPGDKRLKENRVPTEKQKAAQFQPGNSANKNAWNMKAEIRQFRKRCHVILQSLDAQEAFVTMLVHAANNGNVKDFMDITRFLAEYAYGTVRQMIDVEDVDEESSSKSVPLIAITSEQLREVIDSDEAYN